MTIKPLLSTPVILLLISILCIISVLNTSPYQQAMGQKTTISSSSNATKPTPLPTASNFLTYQNPTYGIKIQYPSDWTASQTGLRDYTNIVAFYSPLQNLTAVPEQLLLSRTHYSQSVTLNDYSKLVNETLKQPGVQIVEAKEITLTSGSPAHSLVFIPPSGNTQFKIQIMLVWTAKGDNIYTLAYNAEAAKYALYLPTIEKMINSFEITE